MSDRYQAIVEHLSDALGELAQLAAAEQGGDQVPVYQPLYDALMELYNWSSTPTGFALRGDSYPWNRKVLRVTYERHRAAGHDVPPDFQTWVEQYTTPPEPPAT